MVDKILKRGRRNSRAPICNHDINSDDNTLIKFATRKMIYPPIAEYYCLYCKHIFKFNEREDDFFSSEKENCEEGGCDVVHGDN